MIRHQARLFEILTATEFTAWDNALIQITVSQHRYLQDQRVFYLQGETTMAYHHYVSSPVL